MLRLLAEGAVRGAEENFSSAADSAAPVAVQGALVSLYCEFLVKLIYSTLISYFILRQSEDHLLLNVFPIKIVSV